MSVYFDIVMGCWRKGNMPEFCKQFLKFLDQGVLSREEEKRLADLYLKSLDPEQLAKEDRLGDLLIISMNPEQRQRFIRRLEKLTQNPESVEVKSSKN